MIPSTIIREIEVIQEDIDEGTVNSPFCCPLARALHRLGFESPAVTSTYIHYEENGEDRTAFLPADTTERIRRYDNTGDMEPFMFNLEMPVA